MQIATLISFEVSVKKKRGDNKHTGAIQEHTFIPQINLNIFYVTINTSCLYSWVRSS